MNKRIFLIIVSTFFSIFFQFLFINRIPVFDLTPDIVLIPIAFVAINYGRTAGTLFGFFTGLILDVISGFWGVHTLAKLCSGFVLGSFHTEGKPLGNWERIQFLQVFFITTLIHFSIYSGINHLHVIGSIWEFIFKLVLGQSVYSMIFVLLFTFYYWRVRR